MYDVYRIECGNAWVCGEYPVEQFENDDEAIAFAENYDGKIYRVTYTKCGIRIAISALNL